MCPVGVDISPTFLGKAAIFIFCGRQASINSDESKHQRPAPLEFVAKTTSSRIENSSLSPEEFQLRSLEAIDSHFGLDSLTLLIETNLSSQSLVARFPQDRLVNLGRDHLFRLVGATG